MSVHSPFHIVSCIRLLIANVSIQDLSTAARKKTIKKNYLPQVVSHRDGANIVIVDNDVQGEDGERKAHN